MAPRQGHAPTGANVMSICRCINFAHPEHAGRACAEPAMADEGLCEACHEHDNEEMGAILKSLHALAVPPGHANLGISVEPSSSRRERDDARIMAAISSRTIKPQETPDH
jgi:hypothetical protein